MTSYCKIAYWMHNEHHYHQLLASGRKQSGHPVIISTCFVSDAECQDEEKSNPSSEPKLLFTFSSTSTLPPTPDPWCPLMSSGGLRCCLQHGHVFWGLAVIPAGSKGLGFIFCYGRFGGEVCIRVEVRIPTHDPVSIFTVYSSTPCKAEWFPGRGWRSRA